MKRFVIACLALLKLTPLSLANPAELADNEVVRNSEKLHVLLPDGLVSNTGEPPCNDTALPLLTKKVNKPLLLVISGNPGEVTRFSSTKSKAINRLSTDLQVSEIFRCDGSYLAVYGHETAKLILLRRYPLPISHQSWQEFYAELNQLVVEQWRRRHEL